MQKTREQAIERIRTLSDDVLESVVDFIEYVNLQKRTIQKYESEYGSLDSLRSKLLSEQHTWEEEIDFTNWEASIIELERIRSILKVESED